MLSLNLLGKNKTLHIERRSVGTQIKAPKDSLNH